MRQNQQSKWKESNLEDDDLDEIDINSIPQVTEKIKENYQKEIKLLKSEFRKKEQTYFNELEEVKLSLSAYQMQINIERDHFDVLIEEEKKKREQLEEDYKENKNKNNLLTEKLRSCEEELKEKKQKEAETSSSSRNISIQEDTNQKKKSIFGGKGESLETREETSEYVIRNEKQDSDKEEDDDEKDLHDLVCSIRGDSMSQNRDLFIPKIKALKSSEMDEYHEFNVSMIKSKKVNPMNESIIIFDNVNQQETLNASLSELLR